jgi:hypothetical protein
MKREPSAWEYNWATLSAGLPGWELDAKLTILLFKNIIVAKCKEAKTG